ncbi:MAG: HDOD domain-containing protein [Polyangiaceae bacterium]
MQSPRNRPADYGRGEYTLNAPSVDPQSLVAELLATFRAPGYRPPRLPSVGIKLLELANDPDVDMRKIAQLLEQDALLAGEVVKLGQAAAFGRAAPGLTIHGAVTRLGLRRVSELFLIASMNMRVFRAKGYDEVMGKLQKHSLVVAYLSKHIAQQAGLRADHAFLCGLLHEVGIAGALIALSEKAQQQRKRPPDPADFADALMEVSGQASGVLARIWGLAPDLTLVLQHHQHPLVDGKPLLVGAVVHAADGVAYNSGFGVFGGEARCIDCAVRSLGLTEEQFEAAQVGAWKELAAYGFEPQDCVAA